MQIQWFEISAAPSYSHGSGNFHSTKKKKSTFVSYEITTTKNWGQQECWWFNSRTLGEIKTLYPYTKTINTPFPTHYCGDSPAAGLMMDLHLFTNYLGVSSHRQLYFLFSGRRQCLCFCFSQEYNNGVCCCRSAPNHNHVLFFNVAVQ